MEHMMIGIDVGGTGIKGAGVDISTGARVTTRHRVDTPSGGTPEGIVREVQDMVRAIRSDPRFAGDARIGIALPGAIRDGRVLTAANIDASWVGVDAAALFSEMIDAPCTLINDADAAGIAEAAFGAARDVPGKVLVLTFGTGIGSAMMFHGRLIPNFELGHLHLDGHTVVEQHASAKAIEREGITVSEWAARAERYLRHLEKLFHPDLFVFGGGISRISHEFLPFSSVSVPVAAAHFQNDAGIVGAAQVAAS